MSRSKFIANHKLRSAYEIANYGYKNYEYIWQGYNQESLLNPYTHTYSPFSVAEDLIRSIMNRKKYADKVSKKIISLLLVYKLVRCTRLSLYTLFITTPNCYADSHYRIIDPRNHGRNPITSYHESMKNIRRSWKRDKPYLHNLISSIETVFSYRVSFNVHLHGLLGSTKPLTSTARHHLEAKASHQISQQMNHESVTVHVKPFKDERGSRLQSVKAYIHYILKQYHLPVAKSMADYKSFIARPVSERHALVTSLLRSTKGSRVLVHVISKQSTFVKGLPVIHRMVQPSLVSVPTVQPKSNGKHWTRHELWTKAKRQQQAQNIITLGTKRLNEDTFDKIHKIIKPNKKAVTSISNDIHILSFIDRQLTITDGTPSWFEKRSTGIPP